MAYILNSGKSSYKSDLDGIFETLQQQRSTLLSMAADIQLAARLLALEEARRLAQQDGAADARIAQYIDSAGTALRRIAALEVETQIAEIRVPPVTKTETLLQGRISDEASSAVAHVQVTLIDASGAPLSMLEPVETDDSGYFAVILTPAQVAAIGATRQLAIQVANGNGKLLPANATQFVLSAGRVAVADIHLLTPELEKLKLRPVVRASGGAPRAAAKAPPASAEAAAPAKSRAPAKNTDTTAAKRPPKGTTKTKR